jgi:hypothetical protein
MMPIRTKVLPLALIGLGAGAGAESNLTVAPAPVVFADARLDHRVVVPRVIFLRIGTGTNFANNAVRDRVTFSVTPGNFASATPIAGTPSAGAIVARVLSNGGDVSFRARGTAGGLSAGGALLIPWTQIVPTSSSATLPHPTIGNGVAGPVTTLVATSGIVDRSATFSFNYSNSAPVAAGTYNGRVTYTAALP